MLLLDKLDMDHSDHPFFLPDKALTLPSTTLQEEGAGVVYFFIPTFPSTGTLLHYHSHLVPVVEIRLFPHHRTEVGVEPFHRKETVIWFAIVQARGAKYCLGRCNLYN